MKNHRLIQLRTFKKLKINPNSISKLIYSTIMGYRIAGVPEPQEL